MMINLSTVKLEELLDCTLYKSETSEKIKFFLLGLTHCNIWQADYGHPIANRHQHY
jgi:hypothetical protein